MHITSIKHLLHFLNTTSDFGICYTVFESADMVIGYCDASYANKELGWKSISGYVFLFCNAAAGWSTKGQPLISMSTQEAEYISLMHAVKQAKWTHQFHAELGFTPS